MHTLVVSLLAAEEQVPEAEDVKAGWLAFGIFLLLVLAVVVLCFSLVKQLRKAQAAKDAGVYGDQPAGQAGAPGAAGSEESEGPAGSTGSTGSGGPDRG
ncbi:hypothetical protein [Nocardioides donggukensis]|uniref:Uncharacterized protein n=1 Tax=Nocardioides donggukensis TaxID=2774019 RepID=A0A927K9V5_9ACTN|nr:hypothetical protein [Nocardioides donggukensis]MBD8870431.1 hypothetical protein [Nocardioides donggukensis]